MLTPQSWRHTGADAPASQAGSGGKLRIRPLVYEILYANGDGGMKHPPKWVRIVGTVTEAAIMVLIVINVAYVIVDQQSFNDSHSTAGDEPPESKYFPLELASTVVFTTECALVPLPAAKACVACMRACWVPSGAGKSRDIARYHAGAHVLSSSAGTSCGCGARARIPSGRGHGGGFGGRSGRWQSSIWSA
jgi:hypothetical protein